MIPIFTLLLPAIFGFRSITWHFNHAPAQQILAKHTMSLEKRYVVSSVNNVFKDNILLDIAYITGQIHKGSVVSWSTVEKPFHVTIALSPNETFAFHDTLLPTFKRKQMDVAPAHFNSDEGFKSDGYLMGDGVCHLASLMYWAAKDAKLDAYAPVRHDFAPIPEIPEKYGVAIFSESEEQNLYITNTYASPVTISFDYDGKILGVSISQPHQT